MSDVKNFTPMDMALLRRIAPHSLTLDMEDFVDQTHPIESAVLGAVGILGRGRPTYILRTDRAEYVAQIRLGETHARITLLAPTPQAHETAVWLTMIENLIRQVGRRGIHIIATEVPVDSDAFVFFRKAGFTVYSRERLYQVKLLDHTHQTSLPKPDREVYLREAEERDFVRINALIANTMPQMVQQVVPPLPETWDGLTLMLDKRLAGFISVYQGKHGLFLQPYLHPELYDMVPYVFTQVLNQFSNCTIYLRLRAYQEWLRYGLENDLGFSEQNRYALMARHIVVKKETATFSPLAALEHIALSPNIEVAMEISTAESQLLKRKHNGL